MHLRAFAVVGARSSDLAAQVDRALPTEPDVAVILIGVNDVTHQVLPAQSVRHLVEGVRRLREAGVEVVVGTCPDLGTDQADRAAAAQVGRAWSRRLAAAQTIAVVEAGGRTVSLGTILGPEFAAAPALLFGPDQFHPSADGYRSLADVLLPSTLAALGLVPRGGGRAGGLPRRGRAAGRRGRGPGGQRPRAPSSTAPRSAAPRRGVRGLWVELRHRRREPMPRPRRRRRPAEAADAPTPPTRRQPSSLTGHESRSPRGMR